ncbi:MAG: hypothetical protein IT450_17880 [Phycisphaerales bacterium]|nr:hypothetical protein [Phycisphaerales bacterium]
MRTLPDAHIERVADSCVDSMGDIFWDYHEARDAPLDYTEPRQVAMEAVVSTLKTFATTLESNPIYTTSLRLEYREIVARIGVNAADTEIVSSLIADAAWTEEGARAILTLARRYGMSVLRNALALAESLDIEDGETGL